MSNSVKNIITCLTSLATKLTPIKHISSITKLNTDQFLVSTIVGRRNLQENVQFSNQNLYKISKQQGIQLLSQGTETIQNFQTSYSPQQEKFAKIQSVPDPLNKAKVNSILEVFNKNHHLQFTINLSTLHDEIIDNDMIGQPLIWNQQQNKLLYIAKPKPKDIKNYFQLDADFNQASNYRRYQQDFGEQMGEVKEANIYLVDLEKKSISEICLPEDIFPANPQFDENDSIIFCGYKISKEFKYGILHCFNRESSIYKIADLQLSQLHPKKEDKDNEIKQQQEKEKEKQIQKSTLLKLSNEDVAFKPCISPDYKKLIYFASSIRHQHNFYMSMKIIHLDQNNFSEELIPIVYDNKSIEIRDQQELRNKINNAGRVNFSLFHLGIICYYDAYATVSWLNDSKHFVYNSLTLGYTGIFMVNIENKQINRFNDNVPCSRQIIKYDQTNNLLFFSQSTVGSQPTLGVYFDLPNNPIQWVEQGNSINYEQKYYYSGDAEGFFWRNNTGVLPDSERPLILFLHGGPHASIQNEYTILRELLLSLEYNILAPNFSGSAGYGEQFIEKLSGNIGKLDADECIDMLNQVIKDKLCDQKKIFAVGGSYGGYLSGIMGSRYSEYFKAVVLMNPVVNIPFTPIISDIPEWSLSVGLNQFQTWNLTPGQYKQLFEQSPMSEPMKVPMLLLLGAKDRRCPYQQSLAMHAQTKFNGGQVETYVYPESDHSLSDSLHTSFDVLAKILVFIDQQK